MTPIEINELLKQYENCKQLKEYKDSQKMNEPFFKMMRLWLEQERAFTEAQQCRPYLANYLL